MTTRASSQPARPVAEDLAWPALFSAAFTQSRNAMVLLDDQRRHVDANGSYLKLVGYPRGALIGRPMYELVRHGPALTSGEWAAALAQHRFTGETELVRADAGLVAVQWAATTERATGRALVLFVALTTSRWGRHDASGASPTRDPSRPTPP